MERTATAAKREGSKSAEKRSEPRQSSTGDISLVFADSNASTGLREVHGRLIDRSGSGFRVVHEFAGLTCGQMVQFRMPPSFTGRARVVWTRIAGQHVESGFFIVA